MLPSSVIQNIIEEFQEIHNLGQTHLFSTLRQKLVSLDVQDCDVKKLLGELSQEDLLRACNTGALRSDKSRKSFLKSHFNFVEPVELDLGTDDNSRARYCQYVPVNNTLKALFKNECVRRQHEQIHSAPAKTNIFEDVSDGSVFKSNELFQMHPSSLRLIHYQDAFKVVNPLGSGKKRHKILAVYLSLADLLPHSRSSIDQMQLVLMGRGQDYVKLVKKLYLVLLLKI